MSSNRRQRRRSKIGRRLLLSFASADQRRLSLKIPSKCKDQKCHDWKFAAIKILRFLDFAIIHFWMIFKMYLGSKRAWYPSHNWMFSFSQSIKVLATNCPHHFPLIIKDRTEHRWKSASGPLTPFLSCINDPLLKPYGDQVLHVFLSSFSAPIKAIKNNFGTL